MNRLTDSIPRAGDGGAAVGRFVSSMAFSAVGAVAVGGAMASIADSENGSAGAEVAVLGAATVGFLGGAALGAGTPRLGSPCTRGRRIKYATGGALLGASLGGLTGFLFRSEGVGLWAAFAGTSFGSTAATESCR